MMKKNIKESIFIFLKKEYKEEVRLVGSEKINLILDSILKEGQFYPDLVIDKSKDQGRYWLDFEIIEHIGELMDYFKTVLDIYKSVKGLRKENQGDKRLDKLEDIKERFRLLSEEDKKKVENWINEHMGNENQSGHDS